MVCGVWRLCSVFGLFFFSCFLCACVDIMAVRVVAVCGGYSLNIVLWRSAVVSSCVFAAFLCTALGPTVILRALSCIDLGPETGGLRRV